MHTVKVLKTSTGQVIPLPAEYQFETAAVSIRRVGDAVILEPVKPDRWPEHFFEDIRINDPGVVRPDQGSAPPAPTLD
jgi:virulence-associated protein VagC